MRQAGRDEAAIARDRNTDREAVSFRINTGALSVAQEEILFFDVTPRDLAAVWGIEALSKQMSTQLTPSRSTCVCLQSKFLVCACWEDGGGGTCTQRLVDLDLLIYMFKIYRWYFREIRLLLYFYFTYIMLLVVFICVHSLFFFSCASFFIAPANCFYELSVGFEAKNL